MKLIDKTELLRTLEQDIDVSVTGEENMEAVQKCLQEILDDVKESPVVDAVPVIRCRDCAYYSMNGRYRGESKHCVLYVHETHEVNGDDFCSEAERKEECSR